MRKLLKSLLGSLIFFCLCFLGSRIAEMKENNDAKIWAKNSNAVWRQPYDFFAKNQSEGGRADLPLLTQTMSEPTEEPQAPAKNNQSETMKLSEHFTLEEMIRSDKAKRESIENLPCLTEISNLYELCANVLEPLRMAWGKPIRVTSGYRSEALNRAVGGVANSQHRLGQAADIMSWSMSRTENEQLFKLAKELKLPFDQLIDEKGYQWLHISYGQLNRRQVLHLK